MILNIADYAIVCKSLYACSTLVIKIKTYSGITIATKVRKMEMINMFKSSMIGRCDGVGLDDVVNTQFIYEPSPDKPRLSITVIENGNYADELVFDGKPSYSYIIDRLDWYCNYNKFECNQFLVEALTDYIPDDNLRKDLVYRAYITHDDFVVDIAKKLKDMTIEPITAMSKLVDNRVINFSDIPLLSIFEDEYMAMHHYLNGVYTVYDMLTNKSDEYRKYLFSPEGEIHFNRYYRLGVGL